MVKLKIEVHVGQPKLNANKNGSLLLPNELRN